MSCVNNPKGDSIYLLDDNQFPVLCKKNGDKFVSTNIINGRVPVLFTGGIQGCGWFLCGVNISTGEIDYNNCQKTDYVWYTQNLNNKCELNRIDQNGIQASQSNNCCCDPNSRCDFDNCCENLSVDCGTNFNACDWCDINSNNPYFGYNDFKKQKQFACLDKSGNMVCAQIPSDYDSHKDYYPNIEAAEKRKGITGGIFSSQFCNCILDSEKCKTNPDMCSPKAGCSPCNPVQVGGDYICINGKCSISSKKGEGNYSTPDECEQNCGTVDRYNCIDGKCLKDSQGDYHSEDACLLACTNLTSQALTYDLGKKIKKVLLYIGLIGIIILFIVILVYVFIYIIRKRKRQ